MLLDKHRRPRAILRVHCRCLSITEEWIIVLSQCPRLAQRTAITTQLKSRRSGLAGVPLEQI